LVVLCSLASQLADRIPTLVELIKNPSTGWEDKVTRCLAGLEEADTILLVDDDPTPDDLDATASIFARRKAELRDALQRVGRMIIASRASTLPDRVVLETRSYPADILKKDNPAWTNAVRTAVTSLAEVDSDKLNRYSPLEVQLAVAAVARGASVSAITSVRRTPRELVTYALAGSENAKLRELIARLALCRTAFDDELLAAFGKNQLSSEALVILYHFLLMRRDGNLILHDMISGAVRDSDWLDGAGRRVAHHTLAAWHRAAFSKASAKHDVEHALRNDLEVIHHLTQAGDAEAVLKAAVFFPEQLDALGKSLSLAERHEDAVKAYERALTYSADDAYAHHYIAWNLDVIAGDEERIFAEYTAARKIQDDHVWYHGRLVAFLVTIGRLDEARDAFGEALAKLPRTRYVASELHRPLAQLLLHRGQLAFAEEVLRDAQPLASTSEWFRALSSLLADLRDANQGRLVFPPDVDRARRWEGPHLLRDEDERAQVVSWFPGRISSSEEEGIRVRFGERQADGQVRYFYRDIATEELKGLTGLRLPAGTFVELVELKTSAKKLLSWPRGQRRMPDVPPIFPPPDRYLRRAFAGR
jgi:tetratricopeptide (TPR) repeat protein